MPIIFMGRTAVLVEVGIKQDIINLPILETKILILLGCYIKREIDTIGSGGYYQKMKEESRY